MNYELFSNYRSWYMKSKYETWASNEDKYKSIKSPTTVNGSKRHVIILIVAIFCYKFSKWLLRRHWAHWKKKLQFTLTLFLHAAGCHKTKCWPRVRVRVNLTLNSVILDLKTTTKLVNNIGNRYLFQFRTYWG